MKKYIGDFLLIMVLLALLALPFGNLGLSHIQNSNVEVLSITDSKESSEATRSPYRIR